MNFTIERITENNYPAFVDMTYWRKNGQERAGQITPASDMVKKHLADKNFRVYAAKTEGRFVGWISLIFMPKISWTDTGFVYVDELWVQDSYRKQGMAAALMKKADEMKKEFSAHGIRLYVNVTNPAAKALYEKCGYGYEGTAEFMEK